MERVLSGQPANPDFDYFGRFEGEERKSWVDCSVAFICMAKSHQIVNTLDIGIYLQTLMFTMHQNGLSSCAQGALGYYPEPVKSLLNIPDHLGDAVGLSFGWEDKTHPAITPEPRESHWSKWLPFWDKRYGF